MGIFTQLLAVAQSQPIALTFPLAPRRQPNALAPAQPSPQLAPWLAPQPSPQLAPQSSPGPEPTA